MTFPFLTMVSWSPSLVLLAVGAATDLKDRWIPDEISIALAVIGLAQRLVVSPGSVWLSLAATSLVFCGLAIASHYRIIGGGDLKLVSAVTLLVPPAQVGSLLLDIAFAGGALACLYLSARLGLRMLAPQEASRADRRAGGCAAAMATERERIAAGGPLPYGVAIFGGVGVYAAGELALCFSALFSSS